MIFTLQMHLCNYYQLILHQHDKYYCQEKVIKKFLATRLRNFTGYINPVSLATVEIIDLAFKSLVSKCTPHQQHVFLYRSALLQKPYLKRRSMKWALCQSFQSTEYIYGAYIVAPSPPPSLSLSLSLSLSIREVPMTCHIDCSNAREQSGPS